MRGVSATLWTCLFLGPALVGCSSDGDIVRGCQALLEHRQECGFAFSAGECQETARYALSEAQKAEVLCVLDCHMQPSCEELTLTACTADMDHWIGPCWEDCASLSDLVYSPGYPECAPPEE